LEPLLLELPPLELLPVPAPPELLAAPLLETPPEPELEEPLPEPAPLPEPPEPLLEAPPELLELELELELLLAEPAGPAPPCVPPQAASRLAAQRETAIRLLSFIPLLPCSFSWEAAVPEPIRLIADSSRGALMPGACFRLGRRHYRNRA
jgi:hypothetical protein